MLSFREKPLKLWNSNIMEYHTIVFKVMGGNVFMIY